MNTFVIKQYGAGLFWSGIHWTAEYPDAKVYAASGEAKLSARRLVVRSPKPLVVVENYGFEQERVVEEVAK